MQFFIDHYHYLSWPILHGAFCCHKAIYHLITSSVNSSLLKWLQSLFITTMHNGINRLIIAKNCLILKEIMTM